MSEAGHWDEVYRTKAADSVSWFQPTPGPSLAALERLGIPPQASLIDIGGGASRLVDELLARGWPDVTVLDIAGAALDVARARLGAAAARAQWLVADIRAWQPTRAYAVWHDRAVFHFLTDAADRAAYRRAITAGTRAGSHVIIATFAPDGPERCSGLPVQRHDSASLAAALGTDFAPVADWREGHATPGGATQMFTWALFRRV